MKRFAPFRWFRNVSIARKLYFTVGIMALLIAFELGVLVFSINTLSAVRAYVGGEGLWSKAQKDAIYHLLKYARTRDEADYLKFIEFMGVPGGDHFALTELNKPQPNLDAARNGFIEGRNHPDDGMGMIRLFTRFHNNVYIHRAIMVWSEADKLVTNFMPIGQRLHDEINSPAPSQQRINAILQEIDPLNSQLTVLEDQFSYTLGEGSRWLEKLVLRLLFAVALTVECTGLLLAITVSRGIQKGLHEILVAARAVARGDFSRKARIFSTDEIGTLANNLNKMSEELGKSIRTIERAQTRFRDLLESAPDAIVIVSEGGTILLANNQCQHIFGYKKDELAGKSINMLLPQYIPGREDEEVLHFLSSARSLQMRGSLEWLGRRNGGEEFPVEISLSPLETDEGRVISAAIRDISEKKRLEREIREANITLERKVQLRTTELATKNKELEQFAFVASHDLQEPLRTTSSFVELLRQQYQGKLDGQADLYIDYIVQASGRMKTLINDLLDYSRLGKEKKMSFVNCNEVLTESLQDLDKAIHETGALVQSSPLPELHGFHTELKLLFQNLITNSLKFRKPGSPPEIRITSWKENGHWKFSFADNGIGIDNKYQEKIFVIFQRLHNRAEYEGSGIGLAHCKKIVELHGGKIWVESTPGEGSTFFFTLADQ